MIIFLLDSFPPTCSAGTTFDTSKSEDTPVGTCFSVVTSCTTFNNERVTYELLSGNGTAYLVIGQNTLQDDDLYVCVSKSLQDQYGSYIVSIFCVIRIYMAVTLRFYLFSIVRLFAHHTLCHCIAIFLCYFFIVFIFQILGIIG